VKAGRYFSVYLKNMNNDRADWYCSSCIEDGTKMLEDTGDTTKMLIIILPIIFPH